MNKPISVNIYWPDGTVLHIKRTSDEYGTVVAVVDEFLDLIETHPHCTWTNLADRFYSWYSGTERLITIGPKQADRAIHITQADPAKRPEVW